MAQRLTITVDGLSETGKSTVASIIKRALEQAGFSNIGFADDEDQLRGLLLEERIEALKAEKLDIHVQTQKRSMPGIAGSSLFTVGPDGVMRRQP